MNLNPLLDLLEHPTASVVGAAVGAALTGYFGVPVFYAVLILVTFDFLTGVYKAKLAKKLRSARFGKAAERVVFYSLLYIPLHAMSLIASPLDLVDDVIMGVFLTRELLSILENMKVIALVQGKPSPYIDKLIDYVGVDLPLLIEESLPGFNKHLEQPVVDAIEPKP